MPQHVNYGRIYFVPNVQMASSIWKITSLGNCKLKRDTTVHLLEWWKSKKLTAAHAGKNVEQQELIHSWWECKIIQIVWQSYKMECALTLQSSIPTLLLTQIGWKRRFTQNLHKDVYSRFTHNCLNLEATKVSFSWWMDK